ncbi:autotransporter outer membrane beta-barrel domain-containing protein [Hoeflea prorocentri]|uniref:Autotransporter domain-containing protein n=1 Tax=Hoeflea prorocentri TaxID=1922333 RepID=A0A9X3UJK1_9HYPH|nr:autotransporter outer membrane beta-barrel domain-containing protein [Hoeflea prorocentri]MCY6379941.1 autotransporter domain-containing protein [Hoeflea prorocentri]MDA5397741.1 autotransporter domain-containing protein [Hoeflea prorocentri]
MPISVSAIAPGSRARLIIGALLASTALFPAVAQAQCMLAPGSVTCSGSIPDGRAVTSDFGLVTVDGPTVGGFGLRFESATDRDIVFDAGLTPFNIMLDTTFSRTRRSGFEGRTDGAVSGTIFGDITGATMRDATNISDFDLNNFGTFSLITGTGIDIDRIGEIDVTRPTVTATVSRRSNTFAPGGERDFVMGQFGAIRLRDASGDINFTNTGNVILDGGQRKLNVNRNANPGTNQRVFSTRFSDAGTGTNLDSQHMGYQIEANGNIDITQNGNIAVSGGGIDASSEVTDAIASVIAKHSGGRALFIRNNPFGNDDQVSFAQETNVTINGDVSLTGGEVVAQSIANTTGTGGAQNKAIVRTEIPGQVGIFITKPSERDFTLNGGLRVTNMKSTFVAKAVDGADSPDGLVAVDVQGNSASAFESTPFFSGNTDTRKLSATITGDIDVVGGDVEAEIVGTGTSTINDLDSRSIFTPDETVRINRFGGSDARGGLFSADELDYDIGGSVTTKGGNVMATMTGSNMNAIINGGRAHGFSMGARSGPNGTAFAKTEDSVFNATGGIATLNLNGSGMEAVLNGGGAQALGVSHQGDGPFSFIQTGDVNAVGGAATGTASAGSTIEVRGGGATGVTYSGIGSFSNAAKIIATGGDAELTGDGTGVGGSAIGINTFVSGVITGQPVVNIGTIRATGGNGPTRRGAAIGIGATDFGFSNFVDNGDDVFDERDLVGSNVEIISSGDIFTDGEGIDGALSQSGQSAPSAGIGVAVTGTGKVTVENGLVDAKGTSSHGIAVLARIGQITVKAGGDVKAAGANGAGIIVGPAIDFFLPPGFQTSVNSIVIENGGRVSSAQGTGIFDDARATISEVDPITGDNTTRDIDLENATTVDIAGTLTGGNGTAIDLGNGNDTAIFRQTAVINGITLLGAGEDRFLYQGFTEDAFVDGGDDRDRVVVNAGAGADDMFDPTVNIPNFTNFEAITKTGTGTLTVGGVPFAGMLDYEVDEGLGIIGTDQPNIDVIVASGATFRTDQMVGNITNLAGGLVQGMGTSGNFTNSGTFAPGNSIGTFNVGGDLVLAADGTLAIEIEAPDQTDLVNVDGTTTLGGTLAVTGLGMLNAFAEGQTYTIIDSADAVSGTFATINDNLPDLDVMPQTVDGGDGGQEVVLSLVAAMGGGNLSDKSIVPNAQQAQIGTGRLFGSVLLDRMTGNGTGQSVVVDDGTMLNTYAPKPATPGSGLAKGFYGANTQPAGFAARPTRTAWLSGLGGFDEADTTAVAPGYQADSYGVAGGIHFEGTATGFDWLLGGAIGYTRSNVTSGAGSSDVDTVHIGAYGRIEQGPMRLLAQLSYGLQDYDFTRAVPAGGGIAIATGNAGGHLLAASLAGAYDIAPRLGFGQAYGLRVAPAAALGYVYSHRNNFTETGAGILNQAYSAADFGRGYLRTGFELSAVTQLDGGTMFRPRGGLHWEWGFGDDNLVVGSTALAAAGSSFSSAGAIEADSGFVAAAGFDLDFNPSTTAQFFYEGTFFDGGDSHRLGGGLKMKF